MKSNLIKKLMLIFCALLMNGCSSNKSPDPVKESDLKGVEQGNGMTRYVNTLMDLDFLYPSTWALVESSDQTSVRLSNSNIAPAAEASILTFEYVSTLDGRRFATRSDLLAHLQVRYPLRTWRSSNTSSNTSSGVGFVAQETLGTRQTLDAYFLDGTRNIVHINFQTEPYFDGEDIIRSIVGQLILDEEPPVVEQIRFSRATVLRGGSIQLDVKVRDDLSGIKASSMGLKPRHGGCWEYVLNCRQSYLGYVLPEYVGSEFSPQAALWNNLNRSIVLTSAFQTLGGGWYRYSLNIPELAPLGEMALNQFEVSDHFGNWTRLDLFDPSAYVWSPNYVHTKRQSETYFVYTGRGDSPQGVPVNMQIERPARPTFRVIAQSGEVILEDRTPPKLKDLYFSRPTLSPANMTQQMTVEFEDDSEILFEGVDRDPGRNWSPFQDIQFDIGLSPNAQYNETFVRTSAFRRVARNTFVVDLNFSGFLAPISSWPQSRVIVHVKSMRVIDAVGNADTLEHEEISQITSSRFYIRK